MFEDELLYALALTYTEGLGVKRVKKLIDTIGTAKEVWNTPVSKIYNIQGIGAKQLKSFPNNEMLKKAENEINFCKVNNIKIHYYKNVDYPSDLKQAIDSPVIFFNKGNCDFENRHLLSIVGTRKVTSYGKKIIDDLMNGLKQYPITIVSGLAYGVDIYAHRLALKNNIPTVAVLAHGLHRVYPAAHSEHAKEILNKEGSLLSEFSSFQNGERQYFIQRNRIIAGLSMATIIIESDIKGGAMSTANFANNYNREVFAVPGKNGDLYSKGCNHLIKTHRAQLLSSFEDILYYFNLDKKTAEKKQKKIPLELSNDEQEIFDLLNEKGKLQIDEMAFQLGKPTYILLTTLLELELSGIIKNLPGKYFQLT